MEHSETAQGNAAFGSYLKKVREGRRLSLDAVEELSAGFPEKVTKSHLSRIENGLALPSFPRLMALSHIYGMPIASLAERYELDLRRGMTPVDLTGKSDEEVLRDVKSLTAAGRFPEALSVLLGALERGSAVGEPIETTFRLEVVYCLFQLRRLEFAKSLCEDLLSLPRLSHVDRLRSLQMFVLCCRDLGKHTVAIMALERIKAELDHPETPRRMAADVSALRGTTYLLSGEPERSIADLRLAKQLYDAIPILVESCRVGMSLSHALILTGHYVEASKALQAELVVAERNGFEWLRATGFSHLCVLAYRQRDFEVAESHAIRSNTVARPLEHLQVVFRNCFYLWKIAEARGDVAAARSNERALRSMMARMDEQLYEAQEFQKHLAQGDHDAIR